MRAARAELREIPEVYAVVAPLTSLQYSEAIVNGGRGHQRAARPPCSASPTTPPRRVRQADLATTLARLGAGGTTRSWPTRAWNDFLLFDNDRVRPSRDDGDRHAAGDDR